MAMLFCLDLLHDRALGLDNGLVSAVMLDLSMHAETRHRRVAFTSISSSTQTLAEADSAGRSAMLNSGDTYTHPMAIHVLNIWRSD
jgi:hypothetical protein